MAKAFLSHSSKQKNLVEGICKKLGRDNCVLDKYNFEIGQPTLDAIIKGIESTDLFVLFLSEEALESDWVQKEIEFSKTLKDVEYSKRILVFLVDFTIDHSDPRIPSWLRNQYNIKPIIDPVLLYKKIDSKLRDIAIENLPHVRKKEEIFVGRNNLMEEFEKKYFNLENIKPTAIIASGFEEIGRRKFLKHALDKVERLNKFHEPISIFLNSRDSVEDFILRIEDLNSKSPIETLERIKDIDLDEKCKIAQELLIKFQETNEILFIIDKGCIVQPNKQLANWFIKIINNSVFDNNTCLCLISSFRPNQGHLNYHHNLAAFHVNELTPIDRQILFMKYCGLFEINPKKEEIEKILSILNGMPSQVFHCAKMINDEGINKTINKLEDIKKFNDFKVVQIIDAIKTEDSLFIDILIFISKFEFISYDFVYKIFSRNEKVEEALDQLFAFGVYDRIGINKEYLQVHHAISEYVKRAKYNNSDKIKNKLRKEIESIINDGNEYPDISQLLVTLQSLIQEGKKIPDKFFIPSFVLRTIVNLYYEGNYKQVNLLAEKLLDNHLNYDPHIVREVRYWYCMSLCRETKENFFDQLRYFDGVDRFFLLGFYKRKQGRPQEAEENFRKALEVDWFSQKTRRELVNVLVSQNKYSEAFDFAKENYENNKLNAFHIQGYFQCIIKKRYITEDDKIILNDLLENIEISHDFKAKEIVLTMKGEYEFYINKNLSKSITMLKEAIQVSTFKNYPKKALLSIYNKSDFKVEEAKLKKELELSNEEFIFD